MGQQVASCLTPVPHSAVAAGASDGAARSLPREGKTAAAAVAAASSLGEAASAALRGEITCRPHREHRGGVDHVAHGHHSNLDSGDFGSEDPDDMNDQEHCFAFEPDLQPWDRTELYQQFDRLPSPRSIHRLWKAASSIEGEVLQYVPPSVLNYLPKNAPLIRPGANYTTFKHLKPRIVKVWRTAGLRALRRGKVAVVLLATQEDRSITAPDAVVGSSDIGLPSRKSVFQLLFERVRRLQHLAAHSEVKAPDKAAETPDSSLRRRSSALGAYVPFSGIEEDEVEEIDELEWSASKEKVAAACSIPIYVMCSTETKDIVEAFVRGNDYFGLPHRDISFFLAQDLPMMDRRGRYLLRKKSEIWRVPSAGGGVYTALHETGVLADMKTRPVEHIFICESSNLLCRIADPLLIGFGLVTHAQVSMKCVEKLELSERLPILASQQPAVPDNDLGDEGIQHRLTGLARPAVARPESLPEVMAWQRIKETGKLAYNLGSIEELMIRRSFVEEVIEKQSIPWHLKEVPSLTSISPHTGLPERRSAFKLTQHLEDILSVSSFCVALCVDRSRFYAPVAEGRESPMLALVAISQLHQAWLVEAGATFKDNAQVDVQGRQLCEISPLVSYEGEGLLRKYPEELALPLLVPSRFEVETRLPAVPLASRALLAPWGPQQGGMDWGFAEAQVPIRPAQGQAGRARGSNECLAPPGGEDSAAEGTGFLGDAAEDTEELADDPFEEVRFREAVQYSQRCLEIMGQIERGKFKSSAQAAVLAEKLKQLLKGVDQEEEEAGPKRTNQEGELDEMMEVQSNASAKSDLETKLNHLLADEVQSDESSEDSDDSSAEEKKKQAAEAVARKKQKKRFYFTKRGAQHPLYQAARAVRCKRTKIYGGSYYDPNLPNEDPLEPKQLQAKQKLRKLFLDYDPEKLAEFNWFEPGQAKRLKQRRQSKKGIGDRAQSSSADLGEEAAAPEK